VRVSAAGRTDAGVHADAQVVSFDTSSSMACKGLRRVLARWLPDDVWTVAAEEVSADFDARHSAMRRWYRYVIWRSHAVPAAWQGRCLMNNQSLDVSLMRAGARTLLGRHDFASLLTRPSARTWTERTVFAADWLQMSTSLLVFEICADAYLKQMVRTIVGSLLWVGGGRWTPERFATALSSVDRRAAGPTAPAIGLTLHRIDY
jgi:tRNA pseudouridine38-40 synthase